MAALFLCTIAAMTAPEVTAEITMTLLEDIETALRHVAADFLPTLHFQTFVTGPGQAEPPSVTLKLLAPADDVLLTALNELAQGFKAGLAESLPSLPLQFAVIGASEASGIIITPQPGAQPVYGHVIKLRPLWLRPSEWLRRLRPNLPERIEL